MPVKNHCYYNWCYIYSQTNEQNDFGYIFLCSKENKELQLHNSGAFLVHCTSRVTPTKVITGFALAGIYSHSLPLNNDEQGNYLYTHVY